MSVNFRYIVSNVDEALPFYTEMLGFTVDMHPAPSFAAISKDGATVYLNAPGPGGAGQSMPDGSVPAPGGWNRLQVTTDDLEGLVDRLRQSGCKFRNEIVQGMGGKQILAEDPSGNLVELFEPGAR